MLNNFYVLSPCLPYLDLLLFLYYETISYTGCIVWPRQVNRMTVWRINVKGEPPPQFTWWKDGQYSTFTFSRYPELCRLFHFHFLKITRVFFSCSLSLSQDIHIVDLQVARLRRATTTRWRRRSTKVAPLPSCRSSKPRWTLSLFQDYLEWNYKQER